MMGGWVTRDVNDPDFFSDANMNALGEPASYSDWAKGPNEELPPGVTLRPRDPGDYSILSFDEVEQVDVKHLHRQASGEEYYEDGYDDE